MQSKDGPSGRERILRAARELFVERGYEHTSTQSILEHSGVSRGALYHHFTSKTEVFAAVLEDVESEVLTRVLQASANAASPWEAAQSGALAFLDQATDPTVRRIVLIDAPNVVGWARWRAIDNSFAFGALRAALAAAAQAGQLTIDSELVDTQAHVILSALLELGLVIAHAGDQQLAHDKALRVLDGLFRSLYRTRNA